MKKNRLEAFSDSVIAVAITLLALDLKVTKVDGVPLSTLFWQQRLTFGAYAVSFFIIGAIWLSHHSLFNMATGANRTVLLCNLLLLLFVTAIPFTTSTYGDYVEGSTLGDARVSVIAYGIVMEGMSVSFVLILWALLRADLFAVQLTAQQKRKLLLKYGAGAGIYPIITLVGVFNAPLMLLLYLPVIAYYLPGRHFLGRAAAEIAEGRREAGQPT